MPLASAQVVDAIAARISGLALAGTRVYTSRAWPLDESQLPAWRVVAADEDIEPATVHVPALQKHRLQVELLGYCQAVADVDDALHALASQALTALFNAPGAPDALSAMTKVILTLRRIERALQSEGAATLGLITVTLRAEFHTRSNAPDTLI
jgi:hypothetical protein